VKTKTFDGATAWGPVILLVLVVASWASATVVTKHIYLKHLSTPFTMVAVRFTIAGLFALLIYWLSTRRTNSALPLVGGIKPYLWGGIFLSIYMIGLNTALIYISATLGGIIFFGLNPMVVLIGGYFWLGVKSGWRQVIGVLISLSGIAIVISGGDINKLLQSLNSGNLLPGLALMIFATFGWGLYGLWGKRHTSPLPGASLLSTGLNQLIGVIPVWILLFLFEPNGLSSLSFEGLLYIAYAGIVPSALGFALFYALLRYLKLEQVATIQLFSPVFTEVLAILFLNEPFGLELVVGTVVLLWGVRVATAPRKKFARIGTT
jgi:drug/metabolite transporter (DMT)-like permease